MSPQEFAHLRPAEDLIWRGFLARFGTLWDRYDYDVKVGGPAEIPAGLDPKYAAMARELAKRRIDAVGWKDGVPTIFEVWPHADRATAGALILYERLYRAEFSYSGPLHLAGVVYTVKPDIRQLGESLGWAWYIIPRVETGV